MFSDKAAFNQPRPNALGRPECLCIQRHVSIVRAQRLVRDGGRFRPFAVQPVCPAANEDDLAQPRTQGFDEPWRTAPGRYRDEALACSIMGSMTRR